MGLGKVETELEYFPGVMRPETHVVAGWSSSQKTTRRVGSESVVGTLMFVASKELEILDISIINEVLDTQCELVFEFPEGYLYRARNVEITQKEVKLLEDYMNRMKWFDWRVFSEK